MRELEYVCSTVHRIRRKMLKKNIEWEEACSRLSEIIFSLHRKQFYLSGAHVPRRMLDESN